ncbi:hypothetical protein JOB18_049559 [Solea senegalensis]|uniref:Uncharacterized protein n=1 Tax=Solea senegalensis TaxID=28829 RepID=A0AAV6PUP4_SOLSE|nr:hypothetical protein JOB18_049559 [Solea senegalensis]
MGRKERLTVYFQEWSSKWGSKTPKWANFGRRRERTTAPRLCGGDEVEMDRDERRTLR